MNPKTLAPKQTNKLPKWAKGLFKAYRYKVLYGGRGSGKSYTVAKALLLIGREKPCRILCAREFQNSIADSVHKLLSDQIEEMDLMDFYTITATSIRGINGTEFIFKGVKTNVQSIKSMAGITHLWLEEAQTVSKESWDILIPTIREPNSEIWVTFNPLNEDDPTYVKFVDPKTMLPLDLPETYCVKVNHRDNPWFPSVLAKEMAHAFATDPDLAMHVWEGHCRTNSDAQIMKGKFVVEAFEIKPEWSIAYGADWGFSQDPATLIRMAIDSVEMTLYIRNEFYERGVDVDILPSKWDKIPGARYNKIRADNARPETISYMCKQGFIVEAAKKWSGSVEDGITFLRSFKKIVIHPDCPETAIEAKKYSYKVDKMTGDVTTDIVDNWNHCFDAIRYGLDPMISNGQSILDVL